jgi:ubiquinone/menaquinone biosynthesis C-methylase UbiE
MHRYLHAGARYETQSVLTDNIYNNYRLTGMNTGNLIIGYAAHTLLETKEYAHFFVPFSQQQIEYYKSRYDKIIIAASNFLHKYADFGIFADNLEKLSLPVAVLGLGAQANSFNDDISCDLKPGTIRFAKLISEMSELIGVRGGYTADILNKLGIKNVSIIGCPSYYIANDPNYQIHKKPYHKELSVAVNIMQSKQNTANEYLLKKAIQNKYDVIGQMEWCLEVLKKEGLQFEKYDRLDSNLAYYRSFLNLDLLTEFARTNFYQFYDVPLWLAHMQKYDFVMGTRFHGAMAAIQAGVPAIVVVHDSRTQELCEYLNIPSIKQNDFSLNLTVNQLYEYADYSKFNKEYGIKFDNYLNFLQKNGLKHNIMAEEGKKNVLSWTGERYVPHLKGNIQLEHLHRYVLACEYVNDKVVLDIACGEGYGSAMLSDFAVQVFGVDISEETIAHAQNKYHKNNLQFKVGSCSDIPLSDHSIDCIISFETIEHHDQHEAMMSEIKRVLKPDGLLLISSPDKHEYSEVPAKNNPYHKKELYHDEFKSLLSSYFKKVSIWGQKVIFGSWIFPESEKSIIVSYDLKKIAIDNTKSRFNGLPRPLYFLAIASDSELPEAIGGILEQPIKETELFCELVEARTMVQRLNKKITERELVIAEKDRCLAEKDRCLAEKDKYLAEKKQEIAEKDQMIGRYKEELYSVYTSRSWRYTWPLRKMGGCMRWISTLLHRPAIRDIIKSGYYAIPLPIRYSKAVEFLKSKFKKYSR